MALVAEAEPAEQTLPPALVGGAAGVVVRRPRQGGGAGLGALRFKTFKQV
jgi:hypothetical protein